MPIYEYQCKACGHQFEMIQKFSDEPISECPECGKYQAEKLVSAPSFQLKGSGWYATDFKTKKPGDAATSESKEPKKETKKDET